MLNVKVKKKKSDEIRAKKKKSTRCRLIYGIDFGIIRQEIYALKPFEPKPTVNLLDPGVLMIW